MATTVDAKGWAGANGGPIQPMTVSVAGPLPGTGGALLLVLAPAGQQPVCAMLSPEIAWKLAEALTRTEVGVAALVAS